MKKRLLIVFSGLSIVVVVSVIVYLSNFSRSSTPINPTPSFPVVVSKGLVENKEMQTPRASQTATLLQNGKVLLAGGMSGDEDFLASAELYDPLTHLFVKTGNMTIARASHTATLLPNSKVLFVGGIYSQTDQTAELYDPESGTFTKLTGASALRRDGFTATLLSNGKVLLVGGYGSDGRYGKNANILASAELYDPATNAFLPTGQMSTGRAIHTATVLPDGKVLVAGGITRQGVTNSAEVYDPATGTFTNTTGNMSLPRYKHAAVLLGNGQVLIICGSDDRDIDGRYTSLELYDPTKGTFTESAETKFARYKISEAVAILADGKVFIGGDGERAEIYDPVLNMVQEVQGMLDTARLYATATALPDGQVLIAGGYDNRIMVTGKTWLFVS